MIYLDNGATSMNKPKAVLKAVQWAMECCANPGRGGHEASMAASRAVFNCRERAAQMFGCKSEQVVFTSNCTHGLNIAIRSLVRPGAKVAVSGYEHNAVMRPLYALGDRCGGSFRYTDWGIKDCSGCLKPHRAENYDKIMEQMGQVIELVKKQKQDA